MTEKVRFAQIGVDHPHASAYLEGLLLMPEVEVVALYDPDPAAAGGHVPPELDGVPVFGQVAELLSKERPEAAIISLPNDIAPGAVVQAAEAGVHVYVDKPGARTSAEFRTAVDAVRKSGVQFAMGYTRRSSPVAQAIKDLVDRGLLGRLVSVEARWMASGGGPRAPDHFLYSKERSGGGVLQWLGCHFIDLVRWVTSSEVTDVAAILDTLGETAMSVEDSAVLSLRCSNGMIGTLHCSYVGNQADEMYFGLRGTQGWVRWDRNGPEIEVHSTHPDWVSAPTRVLRFEPDPVGGYLGGIGMAARRTFIASFREGASPHFVPEDGLRVLEVLDAAKESSRTGLRVPVGQKDGR